MVHENESLILSPALQITPDGEQGSDAGNSEYESVDEEELAEEEETTEGEVKPPMSKEEEEELKNLDHDEDRKNPQYIPKKGTFYEHDDRTMGEGEEIADNVSEQSAPQEKETKKKVWKEDGKWQHDRFSAYDQSPKSREELVATYGYDIRNEEGPPRARRRRRYGRGPNKYTRNWEDMDAYSKPTRGGKPEIRGGGGRGRRKAPSASEEEFPALPSSHIMEAKDESLDVHKLVTVQSSHIDSPKAINKPAIISEPYENIKSNKIVSPVGDQGNRIFMEDQRRGTGRGGRPNRKTRPGSKGPQRNFGYSEGGQYMNKNRMEGGRGRGEGNPRMANRGGHTQAQMIHMQQSYQPKDVQDITEELKTVTITPSMHKEEHHYKKKNIDNRRTTIPPRLQESMRGNKSSNHGVDANSVSKPKRYSSQRQRPLPDQMGQYHHSQGYYDQAPTEPGYNKMYERANSSPGTGTPSQIAMTAHAAPPAFVAPSFTATTTNSFPPATRLFPSGTPQPHLIGPPVAGPPIGGPPPVAGQGVPGPPVPGTVGGPPVTGPPFLPPENMINYAAGAPGLVAAPHPPQFPAFQAFTPVSQQQPQEIYSNGVMYYNTQSQQHLPRINPVLQKRPKAAIPIIPPPDKQFPTKEEEAGNDFDSNRETADNYSDSYEPEQSNEVASEILTPNEDSNEIEDSNDTRSNNTYSSSKSEPNIETLEESPLQEFPNSPDLSDSFEKETSENVCLETSDNDTRDKENEPQTTNQPSIQLTNGEEKSDQPLEASKQQVTEQAEEDKSIPLIDKSSSEAKVNEDSGDVTDTPLDTT